MQNFRIFTEGKADIKFIKDYVLERFGVELSDKEDFFVLPSWAGYKNNGQVIQDIKENHDDDKATILILDADNDFANRQTTVNKDFQSYNLPIKLFLFPNNADAGNLEDMLTQIAVNRQIIECFSQYEQCIQGYQLPVSKARIFAYLDALLRARNKKNNSKDLLQPENRNYRNSDHWDLHHNYLTPLHTFLKPFFSNP